MERVFTLRIRKQALADSRRLGGISLRLPELLERSQGPPFQNQIFDISTTSNFRIVFKKGGKVPKSFRQVM